MDWMDLFYFLLGTVIFFGAQALPGKQWNEEYTSLSQTKMLQGFAALGIALHHISQKASGPWHPPVFIVHGLDFFVPVGYLFVAVFLFCSGLGLYRSRMTKPDYLKGFIRRRIVPLIIAFYLSEWICLAVRAGMGEKMKPLTVLWYLSGLHMANPNSWYLIVIPFFYLAFFLAFRLCRRDGAAIALVFLFTLGYTVLGASIDHQNDWWFRGEWWYNSIILFPLGLLFGKYEARVTAAAKKAWVWLLPLSFAAVFGAWHLAENVVIPLWGYYGEYARNPLTVVHRLGSAAAQWLVCIAFVAFCFLLMMKVRLGNRVLGLLGRYSLAFYLMHGIFVELFGFNFMDGPPSLHYIRNLPLYTLTVLACAVPAAALFQLLWQGLLRLPALIGRLRGKNGGRPPRSRLRGLLLPLIALAAVGAGYLAMGQAARQDRGRLICGMRLTPPEGYSCTLSDGQYIIWENTTSQLKAGKLSLDANIRDLNADFYESADDVLAACDWLQEGEIYVNPHGVRMARGIRVDADGVRERRCYVEGQGRVFLMSMNENSAFYRPEDCEQVMRSAADSIRPR